MILVGRISPLSLCLLLSPVQEAGGNPGQPVAPESEKREKGERRSEVSEEREEEPEEVSEKKKEEKKEKEEGGRMKIVPGLPGGGTNLHPSGPSWWRL